MHFNSNFFINFPIENKETQRIKNEYLSTKYNPTLDMFFIKKIENIITKYIIINDNSVFIEKIVNNYWSIINLYFIQINQKNPRCNGTIIDFFNCGIRILEFSIFIKCNNLSELEEIFFNLAPENECFFEHFNFIKEDIYNDYSNLFKIEKDPKNKNRITVFLGEYANYTPISIPKMKKKDNSEFNIFWFDKYFKLDEFLVKEMFMGNGSSISGAIYSNRRGSNKRNKGFFEIHDYYDSISFSKIDVDSINTLEEKKESLQRDNQMPSVIFHKPDTFIKNTKKIEKSITSNFKQHLINKTISNSITKNEMYLISKAPNLQLFSQLVIKLFKDSESYYSSLILVSLFTGINVKNLLYVFLEQSNEIKYLSKNGILRIKIKNDIFANSILLKNRITKKVKNDELNIHFPFFLEKLYNFSKNNIKNSLEFSINKNKLTQEQLDDLINFELKKISRVLTNHKRALDKNISHVNIKSIHKLFYHYFHILNDKTDIGILFSNNLRKNDQARICYAVTPKRLINFENWINIFYETLTKNYSSFKAFDNTNIQFIGSPRFVESSAFKNFLTDLKQIKINSRIEKCNIQMIYLRYSLSIILATRSLKNSCDLSNYSPKLALLTIHEKAKNIKSSKRLIPLTVKAIELINFFFELKKEFNLTGFTPIRLKEDKNELIEIPLSKESILDFLQIICEKELFLSLKKFINATELNFGRHIFSTKAVQYEFNREFTDELMGHYSKGKLGFGIFSNFDTQRYIEETKDFIEIIERDYFSEQIDIKSFK